MRPAVMMAGIALATLAVAQQPAPRPAPKAPAANNASREATQQWWQRANYINSSILQDGTQLSKMQSLLLPARLAAVWAKSSHDMARGLAIQAADSVTRIPQNESDEDRKARLEAASNMIASLNTADRASADRVIAMMSKDAENRPSYPPPEGPEADTRLSLAEAIRDTAKDDPARAFALAQKSLALRDGDEIAAIYQDLKDGSLELANRYAAEALQVAATDPSLLFGLGQLANPALGVPQATRDAILQTISDTLLQPDANPSQRARRCLAAPAALDNLPAYSPAQQSVLRSAALACKGADPDTDAGIRQQEQMADRNGDGDSPADPAHPQQSAQKKLLAASIAADRDHDLQRALDVLDSFTPEERDAAYPNWHLLWISLSQRSISAAERQHDTATIQSVISRAPDIVRGRVLLAAARTAYNAKDTDFGNLLVGQTERELESNPRTDQYTVYLQLLNLCAAHLPADTLNALRIAVHGLNNFNPPHTTQVVLTSVGELLQPVGLDPGVLNADFDSVTATVADIRRPDDRVAMRLGLLRLVLARYAELNKARPAPAQRPAKKPPQPRSGGAG